MTGEEFDEILEEQLARCRSTLVTKAEEYADGSDRLHNFKTAGAVLDVPPAAALAGMMSKHTVSIYDMTHLDVLKYPMRVWDEKITDHINYLILLRACVVEARKEMSIAVNKGEMHE